MPAAAAVVAVYAASTTTAWAGIAATFGLAGTIAAGAVVGAVAGGATAALMGEDIGKGALLGAIGGAVSGGFIGASAAAAETGAGVTAGTEAGVGASALPEGAVEATMQAQFPTAAIKGPQTTFVGGVPQQTIMQTGTVSPGATSGIDRIIEAQGKFAAEQAKWAAIGRAAEGGMQGFLTEDPAEVDRRRHEQQLELERARRIKLTPGFARRTSDNKLMTPIAGRIESLKNRFSGGRILDRVKV